MTPEEFKKASNFWKDKERNEMPLEYSFHDGKFWIFPDFKKQGYDSRQELIYDE